MKHCIVLLFSLLLLACDQSSGGEFEVFNIEPRQGVKGVPQPVKIIGKNFRTDVGYTLYFGNQKTTQVTVVDAKTMLVAAPEKDELGPVDVQIVSDTGTAYKITAGFTYVNSGGETGTTKATF